MNREPPRPSHAAYMDEIYALRLALIQVLGGADAVARAAIPHLVLNHDAQRAALFAIEVAMRP